MITKPSIGQMLRTVRRELLEKVAPHVSDESVAISIGMMGTILHVAAERADREHAWITAESQDIESVVAAALENGTDDVALAAAHQRFLAELDEGANPPAAQANYDRASEMLSCLLEASVNSADDELVAPARDLLQRRVQRELDIIGDSFYGVSG